jgi:hypothetical protein
MNNQNFSLVSFIRNLFRKGKANNTLSTTQFEEDIDWESVPNQ